MAIALVSSVSAVNNPDTVTTGSIDTTGATLLVMGISMDSGGTPSVSDSKGNTWTALTASTSGSTRSVIYYVANPTVGTGHTFTNAGNQNYSTIYVAAFSGVITTSPFDQQNGATGTGASTLVAGSVTPSENNELVVTHLAFNAAGTPISINSSFIETTSERDFGSGNNYGGCMAYIVQTTAGAAAPTWTRGTGTGAMASRSATFKAAPEGPANVKTINGLAKASVKTYNGLAIASIKTFNGLN